MGFRPKALSLLLITLLSVSACDKITETSRTAQGVTKAAFEDTKSSWIDFFTYHPPLPDPLPQTRYCYAMQSDTVCYDSEQSQLTSKLVGYQDGENISWVQPGGGSLGASGGEPVALRPVPAVNQPRPGDGFRGPSNNEVMVYTGPVRTGSGTVQPTQGQIAVQNLPPGQPKKN